MTDPSTTHENTIAHPTTAPADTARHIVVFRELPADQLARLTADDQMGTLFKACAIFSPRSLSVPGFET